jgi:hypothetical protein
MVLSLCERRRLIKIDVLGRGIFIEMSDFANLILSSLSADLCHIEREESS